MKAKDKAKKEKLFYRYRFIAYCIEARSPILTTSISHLSIYLKNEILTHSFHSAIMFLLLTILLLFVQSDSICRRDSNAFINKSVILILI
jgi:hypothetical protein